ncbi:MAG: RNA methyltransferase, partial [Thiovulaceae bacterium]|nr:RNA methyltransferase [Sulfurimonadaceae bacterium]
MNRINVKNIEDEKLKVYHQMRDNAFDELNSFVADSPKVVNILLQSDIQLKSILATKEYFEEFTELIEKRDDLVCYEATKAQMQTLVGHKIHHNCMLHGIRPR